jgi:hypothetical protein
VFDEFVSGKLCLSLPRPECPRIALVAGDNTYFRLSDGNKQMPSREEFLRPLDIMDAAANSPLEPDFLIMLMPPALLHRSTIGRFSMSIVKLLEQRFSVHVKLSPLQDLGIPQERTTLIVVASSFCTSLPWHIDWPVTGPQPPVMAKDLIGNLAFENPRAAQGGKVGFVCSVPAQSNLDPAEENRPIKEIHNHLTGCSALSGSTLLDMDANAIFVSCTSLEPLVHPCKFSMHSLIPAQSNNYIW